MSRREGIVVGQPPKYLGYEDDMYVVVGISDTTEKNGALLYICDCKLCGGSHLRNAKHLKQSIRSRECPEYRSPNWSGYDREDQIMRRTYGLSMQEFDDLVEFQGGKCAVCFKPLDILNRRANVDHCHEANKVRGILCTGCNTGIGHLGDNIEGLKRALYYLENSPFEEYSNAR